MNWEWYRPVKSQRNARDWFIIKVRRAVKDGEEVGFSLAMCDRPYAGEDTDDRSIFPTMDDVFAVTGPLFPELRADGWTLFLPDTPPARRPQVGPPRNVTD
ncbi:hypothetical protein [Streptomyces sp. NPDC048142]|uniref:hypothetical protein n=1 Tax=Streptomyces sp. NPDC048142 TaxID=3365501 RepID=UPI00371C7AF4